MGLPWHSGPFRDRIVSPRSLPNLAAWYDASDLSAFIVDSANRVSLWADKSGNSSVNALCLNGVFGSFASAPDSAALSITGDLDLRCLASHPDWVNLTDSLSCLIGKNTDTGSQVSYRLDVLQTTGLLRFGWSPDGTTANRIFVSSSVAPTVGAFGKLWVRVTLQVNDGAGHYVVKFYTSTDGITWTQLGATTTGGSTTSIFDGTSPLYIGKSSSGTQSVCNIYRVQIYSGIAGTLAFDADFSRPAKLATTFAELSVNAATVTISTSGDTGARICGERDLVQLTIAKQPIFLPFTGTRHLFTNGTSGNFANSPHSGSFTQLEMEWYGIANWATGAMSLTGKNATGSTRAAYIDVSGGQANLILSSDGSAVTGVQSIALGFADGALRGLKATWRSSDGRVQFFTSTDGITWSQLGTDLTSITAATHSNSSPIEVNSRGGGGTQNVNGKCYRCIWRNALGGTATYDFNPSLYASGTTFVAATGETWTVNGGATIVTRTCLYFDGVDDYLKSAAMNLVQPESVYWVGSKITYTADKNIIDGNSVNSMKLAELAGGAAGVYMYANSGFLNNAATVGLGIFHVMRAIFNAAASSLSYNRNAAATGNIGSGNGLGVSVGAQGDGSSGITSLVSEYAVYAAAHDNGVQNRVANYVGKKWGFAV